MDFERCVKKNKEGSGWELRIIGGREAKGRKWRCVWEVGRKTDQGVK